MRRIVFVLLCLAAPLAAQEAHRQDRYDDIFRKYTKRYFGPGYDWRIFKAQGMAESGLSPDATSRVGARGVMQLMPSTYKEIQSHSPSFQSINDPEWNIAAGIVFDRDLWRAWTEHGDRTDRRDFMFASYNAGQGTIMRAQRMARDRQLDHLAWGSLETVAADVPRWRYRETLGYVKTIEQNMQSLDDRGRVGRQPPR
jgi:soluble lytic murein transglycosylase-like protein